MKDMSVTPPTAVKGKEEAVIKVEVVNTTTKNEEKEVKEDKDRPFAAEYFDVPDWGHLLLEPKLDTQGLVNKLTFVEEYISNQLKANDMKADRDTIKDILSAM